MLMHSHLSLAATHLNSSIGPVVTAAHVAQALHAGSITVIADNPSAAAMVGYLFVELEPRLIALCTAEAQSDMAHANRLYTESLSHALPRVLAWENAVKYLCS
jgi:hypothetical protein